MSSEDPKPKTRHKSIADVGKQDQIKALSTLERQHQHQAYLDYMSNVFKQFEELRVDDDVLNSTSEEVMDMYRRRISSVGIPVLSPESSPRCSHTSFSSNLMVPHVAKLQRIASDRSTNLSMDTALTSRNGSDRSNDSAEKLKRIRDDVELARSGLGSTRYDSDVPCVMVTVPDNHQDSSNQHETFNEIAEKDASETNEVIPDNDNVFLPEPTDSTRPREASKSEKRTSSVGSTSFTSIFCCFGGRGRRRLSLAEQQL